MAKFKDPSFVYQLPMAVKYAKALHEGKVIVDGALAFPLLDAFIIDLEYDNDKERPFVFTVGVMTPGGEVKQWFCEDEKYEKKAIEEFIALCSNNACVGYSSSSADLPTLRKIAKKHGLWVEGVKIFDIYSEVVFTQDPRKQRVFFPLKHPGLKSVSEFFGYREPPGLAIHDGLLALGAFHRYLETKDERVKEQILAYNRCDLERTALVLNELARLSGSSQKEAGAGSDSARL